MIKEIHEAALKNGWWNWEPGGETFEVWMSKRILLIGGEAHEAIEALRNNRETYISLNPIERENYMTDPSKVNGIRETMFRECIKDTFQDEVADIKIRSCDMMGYLEIEYEPEDIDESWGIFRIILQIQYLSSVTAIRMWEEENHFIKKPILQIVECCNRIAKLKNFDLDWHMKAKMAYNTTRGKMHGKAF